MIVPTVFTLRLLTTLDTVELGPRWAAIDAAGHQYATFSKMSRRQCVAFLRQSGGTVAEGQPTRGGAANV